MKISEIPFDNLEVGDICISALGNRGRVTGIFPENGRDGYGRNGYRYDTLSFEWENGRMSVVFHMDCDAIEYIGKE